MTAWLLAGVTVAFSRPKLDSLWGRAALTKAMGDYEAYSVTSCGGRVPF